MSLRMKPHLVPVEKPAPPRPRRPEVLTSAWICSGVSEPSARCSISYPPWRRYTSSLCRSGVPNSPVSRCWRSGPCDPRSSVAMSLLACLARLACAVDQRVHLLGGQVVVVAVLVAHHRRVLAGAQALDLL